MDWNVIAQYLPLYEKAAWLTLRLGLAGIALAIVTGRPVRGTIRGRPETACLLLLEMKILCEYYPPNAV